MDWPSLIGRLRPVEQDALRILTVVYELGEPAGEPGMRARIDGERRLQHLAHLVRRPADLAFVLLDHVRRGAGLGSRRRAFVEGLRRLLADGRGQAAAERDGSPHSRPLHAFARPAWERWDDVLAWLGCRGLLRVRARREPVRPSYLLTETGARLLERKIYPADPDAALARRRCALIRDFLEPGSGDLDRAVEEVAGRLDAYREEHRIGLEDDLLGRFCQSTLGETL